MVLMLVYTFYFFLSWRAFWVLIPSAAKNSGRKMGQS